MAKTAFRLKMEYLIQNSNHWLIQGAEAFFAFENSAPIQPQTEPRIDPNKTALLFLHGFSASPQEIRKLAQHFAGQGYPVALPLLPGHGTHPKNLRDQRWMDWYLAAENSLKKLLAAGYTQIVLVGSSVGANLAFLLALNFPDKIKAQIWITPALQLRSEAWLRVATFIIHRFLPFWHYKTKRPIDEKNTVADQSIFKERVAYPNTPFKSAEEVYRLNEFVRRILFKVATPVLVLLGKGDRVINTKVKERVQKNIAPELLTLREFPNSKHLLAVDFDRDDVRDTIEEYLARLNGNTHA